jgi:methyl-accepting chemotaxis protein
MKGLTIRTKLLSGFGAMLLLIVAVGAVGWRSTAAHAVRFDELFKSNVRATVQLAEAQDALARLRYGLTEYMAVTNLDDRHAIAEQDRKLIAIVDDRMRSFEKNATEPEQRELLAQWNDVWAKYTAARPKFLELYEAYRFDEAARWRNATTTPLASAAVTNLGKLIAVQRVIAERQQVAAVTSARTGGLGAALVVVAIAIGFGVAFTVRRSVTQPLETAVVVLEAVARRDFTQRLNLSSSDEMGRMASALNQAMESVRAALGEVNTAAEQSTLASQEVAEAAQQLATRAQEQASNLEETAASLEAMSGIVKLNADNAGRANRLALDAREVAEKGGNVVAAAVSAMTEINAASKRIGEIIGTIDEIAFQTTLLALNAAVEAARAGDQGRGFAVVAAEVRSLAQRSAEAAREIKRLIQDTAQKVETGTALVNQSGRTLAEIVEAAKKVNDNVVEIAAAGREQASGIDQVNRAVTAMDRITQASAAQTEELSSTAQALAVQAEQLQSLVGRFVLGIAEPPAARAVPAAAEPRGASLRPAPTGAPAASARPRELVASPTLSRSANGREDRFEEF